MTTFQTRAGTDVQLDLTPDTPAEWGRLSADVLSAIDRLASAAAHNSPDWAIALHLGPHTVLTAGPTTTTPKEAA